MSNLGGIVDGGLEPGRYRLAAPATVRALRDELAPAGWTIRLVDGAEMDGRSGLFDRFAAALDFPPGFGRNWDAFADCLRDLPWLGEPGAVVLWQRSGVFAAADPRAWRDAGRVIDAAITARVSIGAPPLFLLYPPDPGVSGDAGPPLRRVR